ncbi:SDR family NAD(P)-dependent oxidoreductase [Rhodococcus sp. IEGM 1374]|uniref:SDR family NAD(P)-dependent oxidoreductase n=1 Tax=Rhodococcus sp. IEGM 1374 TaxID=3082221 RepID=UPI00295582B5|nr:SDR family NAD(P)-dependent oxidoreductase [Rhodococcus sp. IEGM 1374]MDV7987666.1 SDR family NAD(P)-dependent oxidoreductase [Rhodococcus sp. IEGM 1374]
MNAPLTVVTGGSRGIGAAVSRRLVADGHDVVIGYRSDAIAAEALAAELSTDGRTVIAVQADTTDEQAVIDLFTAAAEIGTVTGLGTTPVRRAPWGCWWTTTSRPSERISM